MSNFAEKIRHSTNNKPAYWLGAFARLAWEKADLAAPDDAEVEQPDMSGASDDFVAGWNTITRYSLFADDLDLCLEVVKERLATIH